MEYHEIGERFEYDGVVLEVQDVSGCETPNLCSLCYLSGKCGLDSKCIRRNQQVVYKLVEQCKTKDMEMDLEFHGIDYHDIGERFDHYGVTLEVKENTEKDKRKSCDLCYIQRMCSEIKHSPKPPIRNCSPLSRKDRKSVYYVHVDGDYEHKTEQVETKDMEERKGDNEGVSGFEALPKKERVNHPDYYNRHPSGVECITIIRHHNFNIGSVIKYCWRNGLKTEEGMSDKDKQIEDLKKAIFYLNDEIKRLEEF